MTDQSNPDIHAKLEVIGGDLRFLATLLIVCVVPSTLNGLHVISSVYLAEQPVYWCDVGNLNVTWSNEQIREITSPHGASESSCEQYNWDYRVFQNMPFEEAKNYVTKNKKPEVSRCKSFSYERNISSMAIDYNLVCDRLPLKSMIQMSLSLGKFLGALIFGMVSDRFGRRVSAFCGLLIYVFFGPIVCVMHYLVMLIGRFGIGMATSALYHCLVVLISELSNNEFRGSMSLLYTFNYPIGEIFCAIIAFFIRDWQYLQLAISLPAVPLLFMILFIPESPLWLLHNGKKEKANKYVDDEYNKIMKRKGQVPAEEQPKKEENEGEEGEGMQETAAPEEVETKQEKESLGEQFKTFCLGLGELIRYTELTFRLLLVLFTYFACNLSYYALALNVDNYLTDRYLYGLITGLVEMVSYLLPIPFLRFMGRRTTSMILFFSGGIALLLLPLLPRHKGELNLALTLTSNFGRLCLSGVFIVVIMQTTELMPTHLRNSVVGFGAMFSHVGAMSAPFIVDLLGIVAWFIPSTICGFLAVAAGATMFVVPETKNKKLPETTDDVVNAPASERIGCRWF